MRRRRGGRGTAGAWSPSVSGTGRLYLAQKWATSARGARDSMRPWLLPAGEGIGRGHGDGPAPPPRSAGPSRSRIVPKDAGPVMHTSGHSYGTGPGQSTKTTRRPTAVCVDAEPCAPYMHPRLSNCSVRLPACRHHAIRVNHTEICCRREVISRPPGPIIHSYSYVRQATSPLSCT